MLPECCYDYRYEAPKAKIFTICDVCGEPIYVGDSFYRIGSLDVCNDCINAFKVLAEED